MSRVAACAVVAASLALAGVTGCGGGSSGDSSTTSTVGDGNSTTEKLSPADAQEFVAIENQMFLRCQQGNVSALTSEVTRLGDFAAAYPDAVIPGRPQGLKPGNPDATVRQEVTAMSNKVLSLCFPQGSQELISRLLGH